MRFKSIRQIIQMPALLRVRATGTIVGNNVIFARGGKCIVGQGAKITIGNDVCFHKNFFLRAEEGAQIYIGDNVHFGERARLTAGPQATIVIEKESWFSHDCVFDCRQEIHIGEYCLFGPYCYVNDNNHQIERGKRIISQEFDSDPLCIGSDVWLGVGATLIKGCQVGAGAVIAARAVVNKSVPNYEIWGGIPAKRIGERGAIRIDPKYENGNSL